MEYGTRFFGKVDHVPGLFYVATHFQFVGAFPLFPIQSYLVEDGSVEETAETAWWETDQRFSEGFRGLPIPLSRSSVVAGYIRTPLSWIGIFVSALGVLPFLFRNAAGLVSPVPLLSIGCSLILVALLHRLFCSRASVDRAIELARIAKIPGEVVGKAMGFATGSTADGDPGR